jgi:hypothetical protein
MQGRFWPVRGAGGGAERKPAVIPVRDPTILHEEFFFLTKNGRDFPNPGACLARAQAVDE